MIWTAVVLILAYLIIPIFWKVHRLKDQKSVLEEELRVLGTKNQILASELRLIREDPIYLENIARKKFKKAKEGEIVYQIID